MFFQYTILLYIGILIITIPIFSLQYFLNFTSQKQVNHLNSKDLLFYWISGVLLTFHHRFSHKWPRILLPNSELDHTCLSPLIVLIKVITSSFSKYTLRSFVKFKLSYLKIKTFALGHLCFASRECLFNQSFTHWGRCFLPSTNLEGKILLQRLQHLKLKPKYLSQYSCRFILYS